MKTYLFHVKGTHCASCKILLEDILGEENIVKRVVVDLKQETVLLETESDKSPQQLAEILTEKIKGNGYVLSVEKNLAEEKGKSDLSIAIPIGLIFLVLFFLLQKSGILNLGIGGKTTWATGFLIGLIASLSSCLAVVGGLILSLSAKVAKDEEGNLVSTRKPIILFHIGRLASFAVLGGVLGAIGEIIGVNFMFSAILGLVASLVMIVLGINLLGIFKKSVITLPGGIFSWFKKMENTAYAPILIGTGTFFLPCGFTQSMQIAAIGSGSFFSGLLLMFFFALGTLPVLAFLSFGSVSFAHSKYAPIFFKSAGVVVIGLGIFSLLAGFAGLGIINPLFSI